MLSGITEGSSHAQRNGYGTPGNEISRNVMIISNLLHSENEAIVFGFTITYITISNSSKVLGK